MTGDEIIELARSHFGESSASTVTDAQAIEYLNTSLMELYNDLPPERMKALIDEDTIVLDDGRHVVDNQWDRVLNVYVDGVPASLVPLTSIQAIEYSTLFEPSVPVFSITDESLLIRPTGGTITVTYLTPPEAVTDATSDSELTQFEPFLHPALALMTASLMYAQEEDTQQAAYYRGEYHQMLLNLDVQSEMEAS